MLKIIAGGAMLVCFCAAGAYFADKKTKKALFFSSLCDFNAECVKEMRFSRRPIVELLSEKYSSPVFNNLLCVVKNDLALGKTEIKPCASGFCGLDFSVKELGDVNAYFNKLGKTDALTQTEDCLRYADIFNKYLTECEAQEKKLCALYKRLGLIFGLIAFVVII